MKLCELVQRAKGSSLPPVPAGWMRPEEMARREGLRTAKGHFVKIMNDAVRYGILAKRAFSVLTPRGVRKVYHYRRTNKARD